MKKIVALITLLALLLGLLPTYALIYDPGAGNMFIQTENKKSVNMREEPNTDANILTTIPHGRTVLVYSDFMSEQWAHIQYGMFNGYVMRKFLAERKIMYIKSGNGKSVNMREGPSTDTRAITSLPYGSGVIVFGDFESDQWLHVQYGMYNGYMMSKFLKDKEPAPFVPPTPKPTPIPTVRPTGMPTYIPTAAPTATPSPEQRRANEIKEAQMLGIVPPGMKTNGAATWDDLNNLLTNVIRLKTRNPAAQRTHVYLTKEEYEASNAGAQYNMVLRGVAAAEMYGTLLDIGDDKHVNNLTNDPFIADYTDIRLAQQYAGRTAPYNPNDWRTKDLGELVLSVLDHTDARTGESVFSLDVEYKFYPTHPLTHEDAILAALRIYNSCSSYVGTVVVSHNRPVNLRKGPSTKHAIVGRADPGTSFSVVAIEKGGEWYKVLLPDGNTVYISGSMVAFYPQ